MAVNANQGRKQEPRVFGDRFNGSDYTTGRFDHKCEPGIDRKTLLDPAYWSHVSELMTPYSEIAVRCDDGTYYAKYLVLDCGRGWAKVQELNWWNLSTVDVAQSQSSAGARDLYDIVWKGPTRKHVILRVSDQTVLHEGEQRKESRPQCIRATLIQKMRRSI